MDDDRITRIARALRRSARIDPDSILASDRMDRQRVPEPMQPQREQGPVPAWTLFRGAALTFIHAHDERIVSPL